MKYVDNNLMPDEHLYARGRLHWIIFMKAAAWAVAAGAALLYSLSERAEAGGHALPAAYGGLLLLPDLWHGSAVLKKPPIKALSQLRAASGKHTHTVRASKKITQKLPNGTAERP